MKIPILNIYYLLCYAWNKLEEAERIKIGNSDFENFPELFARVLNNGCTQLFKRGLEHNYINVAEEYVGIKGKIDFNASLNKNLFRQGRSICYYDQFQVNILSNQLLKATLKRLIKIKGIDKDITSQLKTNYWKFANVEDIPVSLALFSHVQIHRNNSFYDFLLKICKLIIENTVLDETSGDYHFKDFVRDEKAMAALFEAFVRNFYKKEQHEFSVKREDIAWDAQGVDGGNLALLPKMQTDITLESDKRKIIIETKYYVEALNVHYDSEKFKSHNLYQLYAYLRNIEASQSHAQNNSSEGILLYPTVKYALSESYNIGNHKISVKTINLNTPWKEISRNLLQLIK